MTTIDSTYRPGLRGVIATETRIGDVRGEEGLLHYRGHSAPELARSVSLESAWYLLWNGALPDPEQLRLFREKLHTATVRAMAAVPPLPRSTTPLGALRTGLSATGDALRLRPLWDLTPAERRDDLVLLSAVTPVLIAAAHRQGAVLPRADAPFTANLLRMLSGEEPDPVAVRAIETYLILTLDHGLNASTFTARVIASTGADAAACLVGAVGALSGPLHGGAPSRVLDLLDAIGEPENAREWVRDRLGRGERIMGFGHAVYRGADPRAVALRETALEVAGERGRIASLIESEILAELHASKPGTPLGTNVEFYAAVVMEACGIPPELFTPVFAVARIIGWSAHILEQCEDPRIIRPSSRYVGPAPR